MYQIGGGGERVGAVAIGSAMLDEISTGKKGRKLKLGILREPRKAGFGKGFRDAVEHLSRCLSVQKTFTSSVAAVVDTIGSS